MTKPTAEIDGDLGNFIELIGGGGFKPFLLPCAEIGVCKPWILLF